MASPDTVSALSCKAVTLQAKGHSARAAENFGLAHRLASTPAPPANCLIGAALQLSVIACTLQHFELRTTPLAEMAEFVWQAMTVLLPAAVATLRARRDAGTLLGGKCRATEEAWQTGQAGAILRANGNSDAKAARYSSLVGYATFLQAATQAFEIGETAAYYHTLHLSGREAYLETHHALTCALVEEAVELMCQPRRHNSECIACETNLAKCMLGYGVTNCRAAHMMPEPHRARVVAAFRRLHASGTLADRDISAGLVAGDEESDERSRAVSAAAVSRRLRGCGLGACRAREAHPAQFKLCSACKTVAYCCKQHQADGWAAHKAACKAARSKAAADDAAPPGGVAA
jgi:hypothetical protein